MLRLAYLVPSFNTPPPPPPRVKGSSRYQPLKKGLACPEAYFRNFIASVLLVIKRSICSKPSRSLVKTRHDEAIQQVFWIKPSANDVMQGILQGTEAFSHHKIVANYQQFPRNTSFSLHSVQSSDVNLLTGVKCFVYIKISVFCGNRKFPEVTEISWG